MSRPIAKRDDHRRSKRDSSWFLAIDKRAVLEEVRSFGVPHFDKTTCLPIIRKLLYLLNQGESFTKTEAAAVLCSVIKLNRFEDIYLRRMLYLIAKELCPVADEVDVVTSSLLKDMKSSNAVCRANAIRLLCRITNRTRPSQIEAYLKEAILDHNHMVKSAAIVCAINLLKMHREDLLAVEKLVSLYTEEICNKRVVFTSPLSLCLLARSINQVTRAMYVSVDQYPSYYTFLKSCIYHEDEMVEVQGLGSLEALNNISKDELSRAMNVMRPFFHSPKPVIRFGVYRDLCKVEFAQDVNWMNGDDYEAALEDVNIDQYTRSAWYTMDHREDPSSTEPMPYVVPQVLKSQTNFAKKEEKAAPADHAHNLRKGLMSLNLHRN